MTHPIHDAIGPLSASLQKKYPGQNPERSFIRWYAEMRFGKNGTSGCTHHFVDGAHDMGIDYVVQTQVGYVVIQSKFSSAKQQLNTSVPPLHLEHFANVVNHLNGASGEAAFKAWIDSCPIQANKTLYKAIHKAVADGKLVRFVFATTRMCTAYGVSGFHVDARDEIAYLWSLFEEGFTSPFDDLTLTASSLTWHKISSGRLMSAVGNVAELLDAMHESRANGGAPERLFDQNVRSYLGATDTNKRLTRSYKEKPELFFAKHNGIYIVTQKVSMLPGGKKVHLKFPSVINGAQTLWSLYNATSHGDAHDAKVFMRILETSDRALRDSVIGATNTQNAMSAAALLSHHDSLPEIARRLDGSRVFLERQQKAWNNHFKQSLQDHTNVTVKELVQWSRASRSREHLGTLRSSVAQFLTDVSASETLNPLVATKVGTESARLIVCVASGILAKRIPSRIVGTVKGGSSTGIALRLKQEARIASLLLVHVFANSIGFTEPARRKSEHALAEKLHMRIPLSLLNIVRTLLEDARAAAASEGKDFSNFFKSDSLTNAFAKKAFTQSVKSELKDSLDEWFHG